jgi:hypothetical protein
MFFALQVDRGNLSQAVSDNLLTQLHLTTNGGSLASLLSVKSFMLSFDRFQLRKHCLPHIFPPS